MAAWREPGGCCGPRASVLRQSHGAELLAPRRRRIVDVIDRLVSRIDDASGTSPGPRRCERRRSPHRLPPRWSPRACRPDGGAGVHGGAGWAGPIHSAIRPSSPVDAPGGSTGASRRADRVFIRKPEWEPHRQSACGEKADRPCAASQIRHHRQMSAPTCLARAGPLLLLGGACASSPPACRR